MQTIKLSRTTAETCAAQLVAAGLSPKLRSIKPGTRRHEVASRKSALRKREQKHRQWC